MNITQTEHHQTARERTYRKRRKAGRTALIGTGLTMLFSLFIALSATNTFAEGKDRDQKVNVEPGLWRGNDVQFVVSQDGSQIVPGEELKKQPEDAPRSFIATVTFPPGNPIGLRSMGVSILIPIEIESCGRFVHGKGSDTIITGQFTGSSECSGKVTIIHTDFITRASAKGTLSWEAAPAGKHDSIEIKEGLEAGLLSLTFNGSQTGDAMEIAIERIVSIPLIVIINEGSTTFPHAYGAITIEKEAAKSVDLTENTKKSVIIPQEGRARIQGEMTQRARFSARTAELYSQLTYSKDKMLTEVIAALSDDNAWIRSGAADALGEIGDERSVPYLKKITANDPDENVRNAAEKALEKIRNSKD